MSNKKFENVSLSNSGEAAVFEFGDVFVRRQTDSLVFGNALFVRTLDIGKVMPRTESLVYKPLNKELSGAQEAFDFSFAGYNFPGGRGKVDFELVDIKVRAVPAGWRDGEHVKVDIYIRENVQRLELVKTYFIYPGQPFIGTRNSIKCPVSPNFYWSRRTRLDQPQDFPPENQESRVETLRLVSEFKAVKAVQFRGRTDNTNKLVTEYTDLGECATGNLLFCESRDCGVFFLQEAPPSAERRDFEDHDFRIAPDNTVCSCCWGVAPDEVKSDEFLHSYRTVIGIYPQAEALQSLKKYLRMRFPESETDYTVTVNPWGCGNFPSLVNEQFLMDELAAAGAIHATHYQVDDGWQKGRALQELTANNRNIQPDFWEVSRPHLPHGFDNLLEHAKQNGVRIALWVAPSFNCEYRDWREFADILFEFYMKYDIKMFKIDAIKIRTKEAENNLEKLFANLRERSNGEIFFNLDTTNGQRPGYFMFLEYGNIFLENRYVCINTWGTYHPESTLNNLWRLSSYMRPQVLQIEVPDPNAIDRAMYRQKQLTLPDVYPLEYWLAIAMFANPLIWLAPSQLPEDSKKVFRKMIDLHLKYRLRIFEEEIYPVGDEPDGKSLTGFISVNEAGTKGFILAFRELEGPAATIWNIPQISKQNIKTVEILSSTTGRITCIETGRLKVELADNASYLMVEFSA